MSEKLGRSCRPVTMKRHLRDYMFVLPVITGIVLSNVGCANAAPPAAKPAQNKPVPQTSPQKPKQAAALPAPTVLKTKAGVEIPQATGSKVDEANITQIKYVDDVAKNGDGTAAAPFNSIANALTAIDWTKKAKIVLKPGDYREKVLLDKGKDTLVIEAEKPGTAAISGSDAWTGFAQSNGRWEKAWPAPFTPENNPFKPLDKNDTTWFWNQGKATDYEAMRELVFIGGEPLKQVLTLDEVKAGTFFNDRKAGKLYVAPPAGVNMTTSTVVEVGVRGNDVYGTSWNGSIVRILRNNLVMRGVVVRHAINTQKQCAVFFGFQADTGRNLRFENCQFLHNNGIGLDGAGQDITYKNIVANYNGSRGAGVLGGRNVLVEDSEFSYNGFRTGKILRGNDSAGFKCFGNDSELQTYRRCKFNNNTDTIGFWQDTVWRNLTVDHCIMEGNGYDGGQFELMPGEQLVIDCVIRNNSRYGVMNFGSQKLELRRNFIYGNGDQLGVGIDTRVYEQAGLGLMNVDKCTLFDNTIVAGERGWTISQFHARDVRAQKIWAQTVVSDFNAWGDSNDERAFFSLEEQNWPTNPDQPMLTLKEWQEKRKQDLNSTWNQYNVSNVPNPLTHHGPLPAGAKPEGVKPAA